MIIDNIKLLQKVLICEKRIFLLRPILKSSDAYKTNVYYEKCQARVVGYENWLFLLVGTRQWYELFFEQRFE